MMIHAIQFCGDTRGGGASNEIEPTVAAAWRKVGAEQGWFLLDDISGLLQFYNTRLAGQTATPGFRLTTWPAQGLRGMPTPTAGFGLAVDNIKLDSARLAEIKSLKGLQLLILHSKELGDAEMQQIGEMQGLLSLQLSGTSVTSNGLQKLAELKKLRVLDLGSQSITDADLKPLAMLKDLQVLILSGTKIGGGGLKELGTLKELHTLDVRGVEVKGTGLNEVASLKTLTTVRLGSKATRDSIKALAALPRMKVLDASNYSKITPEWMKALTGIKQLQKLDLSNTNLMDDDLKEIAVLAELIELDIRDTEVSEQAIGQLTAKLPKLKVLK
jgi:hypothetical protein